MYLDRVYARFYKSFNFDSLRKSHPEAKPYQWDLINDEFFPYVEVRLDQRMTAVVGANESGKSHLLSAIEKAITCEGFEQKDLCRYSPFFNVERGQTVWPHLGLSWSNLTGEESSALQSEAPDLPNNVQAFSMFREGPDRLRLFAPTQSGRLLQEVTFEGAAARKFGRSFLPAPFRIEAKTGLPNSISLEWLREGSEQPSAFSRQQRRFLLDAGNLIFQNLSANAQAFAAAANALYEPLNILKNNRDAEAPKDDQLASLRLEPVMN